MDKAFIKNLVENKVEKIELKKAQIKHCKGGLSGCVNEAAHVYNKSVFKNDENKLSRTIIGNTYLWLDSHDDVHAKGCFAKSIKERQDKIFHLHDHEFKITSKVGVPQRIYEDTVKWKAFGLNKNGSTQALFMDSDIYKDYNSQVFNEYKDGHINQHSVGMQYVKIDLAVADEDYENEHKIWLDNIDSIGNKEKAEEKGYFWLVREAKLIEISAVLLGSNELTPTLGEKIEPSNDTQKTEAEKSLQEANKFYNALNI